MNAAALKEQLKEDRRAPVFLLLCAAAASLVWGYLLFVQLPLHDRLHTQWHEKRQQLAGSESSGSAASFRRTQEALQTLLAAVPARNELPRILGQITDAAAMRAARAETVTYRPLPSPADELQRYLVAVSATGRYEALKPLLADLQHLHPLAYLESVSMVNPDPRNDQLLLEARMVVTLRLENRR